MEKKEISSKTATKGLINGFLSYGIMVLFIFFCVVFLVAWELEQHQSNVNYDVLKVTLPIIAAFVVFFLIRLICNLSTYDLFKKCKIKESDVSKVLFRINIFYICCIVFFILLILFALNVRFNNQKATVQSNIESYYEEFEDSTYADYFALEEIEEFQANRTMTLIQTTIIEIGLILGIISLAFVQKSYINKYNSTKSIKNELGSSGKGKHAETSV